MEQSQHLSFKIESSLSFCHDVDLHVDNAIVRSSERGEVSRVQALEPCTLIPATQQNAHMKDITHT